METTIYHYFNIWASFLALPLLSGGMCACELPSVQGRGSGLECQAAMAQEQARGATPHPRSGAAAERSYHTPEVRRGSREEIPLVQGKEQRLLFAGAA